MERVTFKNPQWDNLDERATLALLRKAYDRLKELEDADVYARLNLTEPKE